MYVLLVLWCSIRTHLQCLLLGHNASPIILGSLHEYSSFLPRMNCILRDFSIVLTSARVVVLFAVEFIKVLSAIRRTLAQVMPVFLYHRTRLMPKKSTVANSCLVKAGAVLTALSGRLFFACTVLSNVQPSTYTYEPADLLSSHKGNFLLSCQDYQKWAHFSMRICHSSVTTNSFSHVEQFDDDCVLIL